MMLIDDPIYLLNTCDKNGFFIPPPRMISSANLSIFLTSMSLSLTFAPPNIAKTGLLGFYRNLPKKSSSLCISNPPTLNLWLTPTTLLCARWAAPKASFTKQLPNWEIWSWNNFILLGYILILSLPFFKWPISSGWYRTFSHKNI